MKLDPSIFFSELKSRNIRKTLAIYLSSALTTIGIVKLFVDVYSVPQRLFPIVVTLLTCGLASAFVFAWFHGKEGVQGFSKKELTIHALVAVVAIVMSFRVGDDTKRAALPPVERTIAVLPFKNFSDSKEDEFFSDGITEDILTQLSKIGELNVISRTTAMKYKNTTKAVREIAEELGVGAILEGSVRRMGPRVRIVGQLIDARNDNHLWADTYDRDLKDIFAIQSEVAQTIAAALKAKLSPDEKNLIEKKATESLDAYAYYLRGRDYYYRLTKDDNERAIEMFKKAIVLDPKYALAHAGLADAYAQRVQRFGYDVHWADSSIRISEYAIELDPNIPEPYKSLGLAYYQRAWYQRAGEQYRKALALNPNYASVLANYGELTSWTGRQDEGLPYVRKSILLMPGRTASYHVLGTIYRELEIDTAAERWYKRAIELDPSYIYSYVGLSQLYMTNGRMKEARTIIDSLKQTYPDESFVLTGAGDVELFSGDYLAARNLYQKAIEFSSVQSGPSTQLGFVLLKTGNIREGDELLGQSIKIAQSQLASKSEEPEYRYDLARVYAVKKDTTKAIEWLRQSIELGWRLYRWTLQDPLLENIRSTQGFRQLMGVLKAKIETMRARVISQELSEQKPMTR